MVKSEDPMAQQLLTKAMDKAGIYTSPNVDLTKLSFLETEQACFLSPYKHEENIYELGYG